MRTQQMLAPIHSASNQTTWFKKKTKKTKLLWMCLHAVIQTYMWQQPVVALHQQRTQLRPAQTLQPMVPQDPLIVIRLQLVGEGTSSPVVKEHVAQPWVCLNRYSGKMINSCKIKYTKRCWNATYLTYTTLVYSKMLTGIKVTISPDLWNAAMNMFDTFVVVLLLSSWQLWKQTIGMPVFLC